MSSKRNLRARRCSGKRAYNNLRQALGAQRGHAQTFGETIGVYFCQFCRHYHLEHPIGQKRTRANFKEVL